jgi:hypothetical protein
MNELILLGAGASAEANVPTAYGMTEEILRRFQSAEHLSVQYRVLSFCLGGLLFKRGIEGKNPLQAGVNVEELFNAVQLLSERNSLEASPFIGSWHSVVEELDQIVPPAPSIDRICRGILDATARQVQTAIPVVFPEGTQRVLSDLERALSPQSLGDTHRRPQFSRVIQDSVKSFIKSWAANLQRSTPNTRNLQKELQILAQQQPKPGFGQIFRNTCEHMVRALVDIVWISDSKTVEYLKPLVLHAAKTQSIIATLNYDNSIEFAASLNGTQCDTGIDEWSQCGRFSFSKPGIKLLKLHGSIEWRAEQDPDPSVLPQLTVRAVSETMMKEPGYQPALIFGSRNKLTAEGPFLDLFQTFTDSLNKTSTVTIVGYSFSDTHINSVISRWMNADKTRRLRIVTRTLNRLTSNFSTAIRGLAPERVEFVEALASEGFRKLYRA